jgi:phenylacetaldehyde dehydrogenase
MAGADLPAGVFQMIHGGADVGEKLAADPRIKVVSYSGGVIAGRAIAQACAAALKPAQLEIHGLNPMIVLDDADMDAAAEGIVTALTTLNGQWSRGLGRLLIHRSCYHPVLKRALERMDSLRIGDSLSQESDLGPLIHAGHRHAAEEIRDKLLLSSGVMHVAGKLPELPGYFMHPALITNCSPDDTQQIILGPVAAVHLFKDDAEAISLANQPQSAAIAYIYGRDESRARQIAQEIEATSVAINGVSLYGLHPLAPRTGWGLSGLGEAGVAESIRFFSATRAVGVAG